MPGGSMEYLCYKVHYESKELLISKCPIRKAFGAHLNLISKALHDIEWVDSSDMSEGDELPAILKVITHQDALNVTVEDAKNIIKSLQNLVEEIEK